MNESPFNNSGQSDINSPEFEGSSNKSRVRAISNAGQALQIAIKLTNNDQQRDIRRARVLAAFNGAAPYCDSDLKNKAQSYRYNVSFGFMEGVVGRAMVPYNDLTINIADLTEIQANLPDAKLEILRDEFGKIIQKWGRWPKFISRLNQDLVLNGYNAPIWPSDYDPFPVFVYQKDGFVDDGSPNDVNDLELFVWRKSYLIHELYAKIEDQKLSKKAGWNVDNVRKALMDAMPKNIYSNVNTLSGQWTAIESAIRGGSLWSSIVGAKMVDVFHVLATELDGKVSHYIVLNSSIVDSTNIADDSGIELFKKEDRFDSMRDILVYFDLETGDGTWHGSKGIGQRIYNTHVANDKLLCSMLDQTFASGLTMLQPTDQTSQEDFTLTVVGPFAVIPPGIGIQPVALPAVAGTLFQAASLLTGTSNQRVGDVVPQSNQPLQPSETATEARIKEGRSQLITKGNLKRYIDPISEVLSIIVRRLLKKNSPNPFAKEFQKEIERKGITEDDIKEIRGARNTGRIEDILGNTAQNTQIVFAEFRGDPSINQEDLKRRRIVSLLDSDAAEELMISDKDQTLEIESARAEEIEINTIVTSGIQVPVSPRDNHESRLAVDLDWLGNTVKQQAQGLNPNIIPTMKLVIAHADMHLGYLEKDKTKKAAFKDLQARVKLSVDAVKNLEKQAMTLAKGAITQASKIAKTPEEFQQIQQAQQAINQREQPPQPPQPA